MWSQTYRVPNRFGMRAVLIGTALLAVILTLLAAIEASLRMVAPLMGFLLVIGLSQMAFGRIPRLASVLSGAVLFPLCAVVDPFFDGRRELQPVSIADAFWLVHCGGIAGYLGGVLLAGMFLVADRVSVRKGANPYSVPRRFGTGTLLMATTLFALLFAVLQYARARPEELFFYTAFVLTVSVSQMVFERSPRWASIAAGGFFLPLSIVIVPLIRGRPLMRGIGMDDLVTFLFIGLFIGYLGGAVVAGIFLACDFVARLLAQPEETTVP